MIFHIITIFPQIFDSYLNESILKRAQNRGLIKIKVHNLRDWTKDKHKTVDDVPYGGGAGMVMKVEPLYKALRGITPLTREARGVKKSKIILLSAKGKLWTQQLAQKYSKLNNIILICGRYEGVDERVKKFVDDKISIGPYVLTGGEIPALTIIDSITRLLPGVLGNAQSAVHESHSIPGQLEHPQYTRPEVFTYTPLVKGGRGVKTLRVPRILLSGNHKNIEQWKKMHSKILKFDKKR